MDSETLVLENKAGFFSCYTTRLLDIISYFNTNKKCPKNVDSSKLFIPYKNVINIHSDYTYEYIKLNDSLNIEYSNEIKLTSENAECQFSNYKNINFQLIKPFIDKYFSPSDSILKIVNELEKNYNLDYENLSVFYYRGTDKYIETNLCNYDIFIEKAKEIKHSTNNKFLLVSDEINLINLFKHHFPETIVFNELLCNMSRSFIHSQLMLASVLIMSKGKYVICTSSNVSMWIILFRGNNNNIYQYLSPKEYIYNVKNAHFDSNNTTFWL
jgi:hypothetical protein